jgi:hypothetical protein
MNKWMLIIATIILGSTIIVSCDGNNTIDDDKTIIDDQPRDNSLAGSISFLGYNIDAEGVYDGVALENFQYNKSQLDIRKVSDTEVYLSCISKWGDATFQIIIPLIPVSGIPHDATFNSSSNDVTFIHDGIKYDSTEASISGWIKEVILNNSYSSGNGDPATPDYTCEIIIACNVNSANFNLKITAVQP